MRTPISPVSCLAFAIFFHISSISYGAPNEVVPRIDQAVSHNLLEVFRSRDTALEFIDQLRVQASKSATERREQSLAELGGAIRSYLEHETRAPLEQSQGTALLKEAADSYAAAAELALADGRIRYSRHIAELAYQLGDKALLVDLFRRYLANFDDEKGRYVALIDYAVSLAKFNDSAAAVYFDEAVHLRRPRDSVEAHVRYAQYLVDTGQPELALDVLDRFEISDRQYYFTVALMRQKLMHLLNLDTAAVDDEMAELRESLDGAWGIGAIPKLSAKRANSPRNVLHLSEAYAFAHTQSSDDSRGPNGNLFLTLPSGNQINRVGVNIVEVVYNEARSELQAARLAVLWSARNRALINMGSS